MIEVKESLKTSLKIEDALVNSPKTFDGWGALYNFLHIAVQRLNKFSRSLSSSATFLPSATVRTITPNPLGLMLFTNLLRRSFSSLLSIFCETEIRFEKGTNTI